jgi:GntR family carbon starvation induced transcriptional regulator
VQLLRPNSEYLAPVLSDAAPKTLAEAVYLRLRQDILSGKLEPGLKLRFADLTSLYEAGVSTLRESLSRLTADRLVIALGQRGFRVAPISLNEMWDITRLRAEMESAALEEAIDAGNDEWEAEILSCLHRLIKLENRGATTPLLLTEEGAYLHKLFHMSLLNASPSVWRLRVIDLLYDQSERYRRLQTSYLSGMLNSGEEHREISAAAIARDKPRATMLLRSHYEKTAKLLAAITDLWKTES